MIIATAGHVDHGKTSLVNALTGIDTDRLEEEKQRGLTIDLGFAYADAETGGRLGFVDVPGHIRFINNMLAGVAAVDFALLVIAADDGVMPQTIEHLEILNLLGVSQGAVALTKIDRCEATRVDEVVVQIQNLIKGSSLSSAEIYPVSSTTGEGVDVLRVALDIAADEIAKRAQAGCFRLAIDRSFTVKGSGIVVTGSVFAGTANTGDDVWLMPQGIPVRIRNLHTQNQATDVTVAGDRCAANITGQLELEDIHRGNWLTSNAGEATSRVDVRLRLLPSEQKPLAHWTPVHIHSAANHVTGRVALLEGKLMPGDEQLVQLSFQPPINLCTGDRIVIRDQSALRTLGGGVVLDPNSPKRGRAKPERIDYLKTIDPGSPRESLRAVIANAEFAVSRDQLTASYNLTTDELESILQDIDVITLSDGLVIDSRFIDVHQQAIAARLDEWHEENTTRSGLPLNQIQGMFRRIAASLLNHVIDRMLTAEELIRSGNTYKRPGFDAELSPEAHKTWQVVEPILKKDTTKPPVLHDLAEQMKLNVKQLEKQLDEAVKLGLLVRPVKNRYFLPDGIRELKQRLVDAAGSEGTFTVKDYRDLTGIGRNLSIEMLEYFDRQGVTQRIGDIRKLRN